MVIFFKTYKLQLFLLLFVSIIIYGKTINYDYAIDDKTVLEQNKFVLEGISGIEKILTTSYWEGYVNEKGLVYRPIPLITYVLSNEVFPNTPKAHHFINILIWIITLFVLFFFLQKYLLKEKGVWYVFFVCLLWSVLPTNIEAIANIKGRDDVLCFLFAILGLIQVFKGIEKTTYKNLIIGGVLFVLSLFSKETAIIFLPIILLILYLKGGVIKNWIVALNYITFFLIALAIRGFITYNSTSVILTENNSVLAFDGIDKVLFQLKLILTYHLKLIFPISLSWDYSYGYFEIKKYWIQAIIALLITGYLIFTGIKALINKRYTAIYIAIYLLGILLVSNLFFLTGSTFAERFLFIPSIGIVMWFIAIVYEYKKIKPYRFYIIISLILIYSGVSYFRVSSWKNNNTLITNDYNKDKKSFRTEAAYFENQFLVYKNNPTNIALKNEVSVLARELPKKYPKIESVWNVTGDYFKLVKDYKTAKEYFNAALNINPKSYDAYSNLGYIEQETKNYDKAIIYYNEAIKINPNSHLPFSNLGLIYHTQEKYLEAKKYYEKSLSINSDNPSIQQNLLNVNHAIDIYNIQPTEGK